MRFCPEDEMRLRGTGSEEPAGDLDELAPGQCGDYAAAAARDR